MASNTTKPVDPECIFCKIVAGQAPAYIIYEDEQVMCFLDIRPLHLGHALIIPKAHYARLDECPAQLAGACMSVVPAISRALMKASNTDSFNIMVNSGRTAMQEVFHVHHHIIPRSHRDGMSATWGHWTVSKLERQNPNGLLQSIKQNLEPELSMTQKNENNTDQNKL